MKIAQVVTLVSPDNAYGGPLRVAMNQLTALASMGHEVRLFSTHRGYSNPPREMGGVPLTSFPARRLIPRSGFAGFTSLPLLVHLRHALPGFDVVHVHLARDLVTLPAASLALMMGIPLFAQTHGMIVHSSNPLSRPLDAALTRRVLEQASAVFYLTEREKRDLEGVSRGGARLTHLQNGVPPAKLARERGPEPTEVLFLARLHVRKGASKFVRAAAMLADDFPDVRFRLVGPDEGEGALVTELIRSVNLLDRIRWEGSLPPGAILKRLANASIYVLPSDNEPFPMSVLEAASLGLPVVITDTCGLASSVIRYGAGIVIGHTVEALVTALRRLLSEPGLAEITGARAQQMAADLYGMERVAAVLLNGYQRALTNQGAGA